MRHNIYVDNKIHIVNIIFIILYDNISIMWLIEFIPEQFTVKAHQALFEGEGRDKKIEKHFPEAEEFSSRDFGLRSFRRPEISAWA